MKQETATQDSHWAENFAQDDTENIQMDDLGSKVPAPQVIAALEDRDIQTLPTGVGSRWRAILPENKLGVWVDLRQWVDWLITEYKISKQQIPPCWYRHTDITAELYAMRCAERKTWEGTEPQTTAAFQFHPHLYAMLQRLSNKAGKCLNTGKHVETSSFTDFAADTLPYDEADWAHFLVQETETQVLTRGDEDLWWRRRVELMDAQGTLVPQLSEPILVPKQGHHVEPKLETTQRLMETTTLVEVASTSYGMVNTSVWEFTKDPASNQWQELEISKEDRSDAGTAYEDGPEDE